MKTTPFSCTSKIFSLLFLFASFSFSCSGGNTKEPNLNTDLVKLKITPKQCKEPWLHSEGNTLENKVRNYLKDLNIKLRNFENITPKDVVMCQACEICSGPTITIKVDKTHVDRLIKEGFSLVPN
ncbi:hypothetical protein ATE84_0202 [Aquimarina sp. MAR_2010_214]|uniref:hypothetical protein n=1 Tax=Aquimarina sp. MAR_2010_214 TaxID=1250026 RepID=UPI000C6FE61C|nr:hypothetical protein [Aquimarina sp. MAR_2010_214]PKV48209.1 hypothetical protein ATE84_0202 [Aquimarina sp. MAR_2010_214]